MVVLLTSSVYKVSMIYQISVACPLYFYQKKEKEIEGWGAGGGIQLAVGNLLVQTLNGKCKSFVSRVCTRG